MGVLAFIWDSKQLTNRYFSILCLCIVLWLGATSLAYLSNNASMASLWFKIDNFGVMFISPAFYAFSSHLTKTKRTKSILLGFFIALIFGILNFTNNYFSEGVRLYYWGFFPKWNFIRSIPFFLFWFGFSSASFVLLFNSLKKTESHSEKNKIKFVILAFTFAYFGSIDYLATFGVEFYPFGFIPIFFLVSIIFYAIVKHKLMDFNLLGRWGLVYGSYALAIAIVISFLIFLSENITGKYFHDSRGTPSVLIACIVVGLFEPIRKRINKWVDSFIFHSPDFRILLDGIENGIKNSRTIHELCEISSENLMKIMNVHHAGIVLWDFHSSRYEPFPKKLFNNQIISKIGIPIGAADFLVRTLETERRLFKYGIVVDEELTAFGNTASRGERTTFWKIRRSMRWLGAAVCVPLMSNRSLMGFIALGPKSNNTLFNNEDKKLISHLGEKIESALNDRSAHKKESHDSIDFGNN